MDYAVDYKRAATAVQKCKAEAAAPKRRGIPATLRPQERCRRGAARQAAVSPCGDAAYGFLKLRFLPHLAGQPVAANAAQEESFYNAFALLCRHYQIKPMETRFLGYPYNKAVALWEASKMLRHKKQDIQIVQAGDADSRPVLQTKETYNTGNILYYIPVVPLHRLLQDRRTKRAAGLLLCTCAYLMHIAGIPYYTDDSTYLAWQYQMVQDWIEDDPEEWEQDYYWQNRSELHTAEHIGNVMGRRLWNPCHLNRFTELAEGFTPRDSFGCACLNIAEKALGLWRDHPQGHVYRHADAAAIDGDADDYDRECITMDKYIGFCAETQGWLYHTLSECVNNEFNECGEIQEPVLIRTFDGRTQDADSLDYENRLFALIDDLCYVLNNAENESN